MKQITISRLKTVQFAETVHAFIAHLDRLYAQPTTDPVARGKKLAELRNFLDYQKDHFVMFALDAHLSSKGKIIFHGLKGCKRCRRPAGAKKGRAA